MQMALQLNHTDKTNGSMGLELVILEGEYDGVLSWPFNHTFELMIVNQRQVMDSSNGNDSDITVVQNMSRPAAGAGNIVVEVNPANEPLCPRHSFTKPIERNPPCGRKNLISFARVSRSTGFIQLGSLLVKARIRLSKL